MTSIAPAPKSSSLPVFPVSPVTPAQSPTSHNEGQKHDQANTVITPTGLALTDTVLSYCAQVDRSEATAYLAGITMIIQGHPGGEIAAVRMTPDYAKTQATTIAQLANVSSGSGVVACRIFSEPVHKPHGISSPIRTPLRFF